MIHKSVEYFYYSYLHLVSTLASMYANEFYDMPDELENAQWWLWAKIRPDQSIRTKLGWKTARWQTWAKVFQPGAIRTNFRSVVRTRDPSEVSGCFLYNQGSSYHQCLRVITPIADEIDGILEIARPTNRWLSIIGKADLNNKLARWVKAGWRNTSSGPLRQGRVWFTREEWEFRVLPLLSDIARWVYRLTFKTAMIACNDCAWLRDRKAGCFRVNPDERDWAKEDELDSNHQHRDTRWWRLLTFIYIFVIPKV